MLEPFPRDLSGRERIDQHGVVERHGALAPSGPFLDPRDLAAYRSVEKQSPRLSGRARVCKILQPVGVARFWHQVAWGLPLALCEKGEVATGRKGSSRATWCFCRVCLRRNAAEAASARLVFGNVRIGRPAPLRMGDVVNAPIPLHSPPNVGREDMGIFS